MADFSDLSFKKLSNFVDPNSGVHAQNIEIVRSSKMT
jgi:hypothetical protein